MLPLAFSAEVARHFGPDFLVDDAETRAEYGRDRSLVYRSSAAAIAFPRSTAEVAALLALCSAHRVAVVPSGGRTGLAGGAVAKDGELVVSLERMRKIGEVDALGLTLAVEAGAITEAVHGHLAPHGLTWPIDFAAKGSAHIGGNLSTNAGGVKVIRYGLTRHWVLGLTVVLASGEVLTLGGALEKNNTGVDLRQLFIGAEGTLGIITEATLKLARLPEATEVLLLQVADLAAALRLFRTTRKAPFTLAAFELFTELCLERVVAHQRLRRPFSAAASHYLLVESEGAEAGTVDAWMAELAEAGAILDGTRAQSAQQAKELWALREGISEALSAAGRQHKNDIALPVAALERFCADFEALFARDYPGWQIGLFGHVGDGNLHINVMKPAAMSEAEFASRTSAVDHDLFTLVRRYGGSISAEHGIGLLKKPYLGYSRSPNELALMREIKRTLDPLGIMNPGKIFDP